MIRDITVVTGSHQREVVQYIRPEIWGVVLDSLIAVFSSRDFKLEVTNYL